MPKNALVKQYSKLFRYDLIQLEIQTEALHEIAKKAIEQKTGARGLRSILDGLLMRTMFEAPSLENVKKIVVTADTVRENTAPIRIER
ncbi:MAG: hypothetical protein IKH46_14495 [Lachnospiraceae bacterium]|nr:hypothetical protein [Lachnospiraceae bacterium]